LTEVETTGQAMARSLVEHGVEVVFGLPGAHLYDFIDALHGVRDKIRFIHTRHEQGAAYMAYGYAKSTGRLGVFTVVPGPGVLNAGAALCTAYAANAPVLCLTGNIMSHLIGRGRGQLHELPDQLATMRSFTKVAERINHVSEAGATMASVIGKVLSGRQGPGVVEAPWDVFGQKGPRRRSPLAAPAPRPPVDPEAVAAAVAAIRAAKRPLIMVGGGAVDAPHEIARLAELTGAPVTSHRSGKGVIPDDHPQAMNFVAAYEYWREVDLLIGVGSRLELQFMRWRWTPKALKTIRIDIDPTEMVRLKPDIAIVADARDGAAALSTALTGSPRQGDVEAFAKYNADARARFSVVKPQVDYLAAIREALPRDGLLVEEVTQMGFTGRFAFPVYAPRRYISCGYQDNLGFGFNTALGVKVGHPDKSVVSVSGDGGFLYGAQELATAAQHRIPLVSVVFNNRAYGNVLRDQKETYGGRYVGAVLENPDFVRLAESFGVRGQRVETPAALKEALLEAFRANEPALIEVPLPTGAEASPWPFLHPAPHS
jgi:acetolactate synthase-1/2/3 large subunit